jgi:teichuronic acid biosynthesis protein TuaE
MSTARSINVWLVGFGAVLLGVSIAYFPVHVGLLGSAVFFGVMGFLFPDFVALGALISVAISPQYLVQATVSGIELTTLHKLLVICGLVPYAVVRGFQQRALLPVLAHLLVLILTFIGASIHPNLDHVQPFKTLLTFCMGWFILGLKWRVAYANHFIAVLSSLALVSVAVGGALHVSGVREMVWFEYTGAIRLQGANIPPHLAMLAFLGVAVSLSQASRGRGSYLWLGLANLAILVATGTRGALIAGAIVLARFVLDQFRNGSSGKWQAVARFFIMSCVAAMALYAYWPQLVARSSNNVTEAGFNTSGRLVAWDYFLQQALVNPWFGRGLGAGTVANDGALNQAFHVPHNEYLRFFVDGGVIGTLVVLIAYVVVARSILRSVDPQSRKRLQALFLAFGAYSFVDNTLATTQFIVPFFCYVGLIMAQNGDYAGVVLQVREASSHTQVANGH